MASVYKKSDRKPIPAGAEVITRKGRWFARFADGRGRKQTVPLTDDGSAMLVERKCWYVDYTGPDGRTVTVKGYTDREASEAKGRDLERVAARKRAGLPTIDAEKIGTAFAEALGLYIGDMERLGLDDKYRYNCRKRLERLARECHWPTVGSIRADALTRWLAEAAKGKRPKAARTLNQWLETARAFCEWAIGQHYMLENPLAGIGKTAETDKKRVRRSMTAEELRRLLDVTPEPRRTLYIVAALTGLRADELGKLTWQDVDLRAGCINLVAANTKARRADVLPVNDELAAVLAAFRPADAKPADRLFAEVASCYVFEKDCHRAGVVYRDERGHILGMHSLRKYYGTMLAKAGVSPRTLMECLRVTDIRLVTGHYTDPKLMDTAGAVDKLPRLTGGEGERAENRSA